MLLACVRTREYRYRRCDPESTSVLQWYVLTRDHEAKVALLKATMKKHGPRNRAAVAEQVLTQRFLGTNAPCNYKVGLTANQLTSWVNATANEQVMKKVEVALASGGFLTDGVDAPRKKIEKDDRVVLAAGRKRGGILPGWHTCRDVGVSLQPGVVATVLSVNDAYAAGAAISRHSFGFDTKQGIEVKEIVTGRKMIGLWPEDLVAADPTSVAAAVRYCMCGC